MLLLLLLFVDFLQIRRIAYAEMGRREGKGFAGYKRYKHRVKKQAVCWVYNKVQNRNHHKAPLESSLHNKHITALQYKGVVKLLSLVHALLHRWNNTAGTSASTDVTLLIFIMLVLSHFHHITCATRLHKLTQTNFCDAGAPTKPSHHTTGAVTTSGAGAFHKVTKNIASASKTPQVSHHYSYWWCIIP